MAESDFNIGRDGVMTVLVDGLPLGPGVKLVNFEAKQKTTQLQSKPLNGPNSFREIPEGWEGTFDADRTGPALDDLFCTLEARAFAGNAPPQISIMQTIKELNGTTSRYRFTGCAIKFDDAGTYKSDDKVLQKVGFTASRRIKA